MNGAWPVVMIAVWLIIRAWERRQQPSPPAAAAAAATSVAEVTAEPAVTVEPAAVVPPLTQADENALAQIQSAYPDLHPKAVQRGLALADLLRRAAPGASDAELSRGVLQTSHFLGYVVQNLDDPGCFYARVLTELDVAALDLTAAELACPSEVTDCDP